jgi:aryl-alcohol dehydrogenase-like predicted oxidoreductase
MGVESLDLMQFHWWDYRDKNYLDALQFMTQLLFAYGTLAGGLLSERYLGQSEPNPMLLRTASLRKYKNMVDAWGGWSLLQNLLSILKQIAARYRVSIANVAVRYILEQPTVAGAIVGARLSIAEHLEDNAKVFDFNLDEEDYRQLETVFNKSRDLYQLIGDCGDEYRR